MELSNVLGYQNYLFIIDCQYLIDITKMLAAKYWDQTSQFTLKRLGLHLPIAPV